MATTTCLGQELTQNDLPVPTGATTGVTTGAVRLHRLGEVRRQENVSRRTISRRLGIPMADVRADERQTADVPLSRLYQWREVLDVPLIELLVEPSDSLSPPLLKRARLLRLMKTVLAVLNRTNQESVRRMARTMKNQLTEIMPELEDVDPWHSVGRRRRSDEYGRTAEYSLSDTLFVGNNDKEE